MKPKRKFKYAIFDKDGVLTDSVGIHFNHFKTVAKELFSIPTVSKKVFGSLVGTDWRESLAVFPSTAQDRIKFIEKYDEGIQEKLQTATLYIGVMEIIKLLRAKDLKLAISSSAHQSTVDDFLTKENLGRYFSIVRGNPGHPVSKANHFIEFAHLFEPKDENLFYDQAFIVEDMAHGIEAAKDLGLFAIGLETSLTGPELKAAGADVVVPNHEALLEYLKLHI